MVTTFFWMIKKKAVVNYGKYTHNSQIPQKYRCCGIFPMQKVVSWLFKGILHKFTKVPQISPSQRRKLTPQLHLCTKIASTDACGPDAHGKPPKSSNQTSKPHIPNCLTPPASFVKVLIHTCESPKLTGLSRKFT